MKKRLPTKPLVLAILLLTVLLVAACGGAASPTATPEPPPSPTAAPVDLLAKIQQDGVMRVGVSADYEPFEYYDSKFKLDGFDIALMKAIGEELGVTIEFNDFAFEGLGGALQLGQIDTAISAISVTPEREEQVSFSDIYYIGDDAVLVNANSDLSEITTAEEVAPLRIGVQGGTVYQNYVEDNLVATGILPQENLSVYADMSQAVRDLKRGFIDAVLLDRQPAETLQAEGGVKIIGEGLNKQRYAIALPLNQTPLRRAINQALDTLKNDGVVADLAKQYLDLDPEDIVPIPTPTPEPTAAPEAPTATPRPPVTTCVDGMAWVADLTFDDSNMTSPPVVPPGQSFTKSWRVRNSGTCTWDSNYVLAYDHGNVPAAQMGGQPVAVRGTVAPGQTYDFSVNLVAPTTPGVYQGFWQMRNPNNVPFGETIWVGIRVPAPPQPTVAPTQTPVANINFSVNSTNINQGQCVTFQWSVTNVQAVYFYADGQNWQNNGVAGQGSSTQCPAQTTTYNLRVVQNNGTVETRSITIYVTPVANAPQITQFSLNPSSLQVGQCLLAQWNVQGSVNDVQLLRNNAVLWDGAPFVGSMQDCPPGTGQMTYTLVARGPGGTSQAVQTANVTSAPPTNTPVPPPPTNTPVPPPPTNTPVPPPPTNTPVPPPASIEGSWILQQMNGAGVIQGINVTANFVGGQLTGFGGCNNYNSSYQVADGFRLLINPVSSTQIACDQTIMDQENAYFAQLPQMTRFQATNEGLTLTDTAGSISMFFSTAR
ncbi:MAG: transporter substrate-binding domain-containing protein [Caldilineales bacterium]